MDDLAELRRCGRIMTRGADHTTTLVGPTEKAIDAREVLERAGFGIVSHTNGGADAQFVIDGGYWPEIEAMVRHLGWWTQGW